MVERQDPDNFTHFQMREMCALEIAACVFNRYPQWNLNNHAKILQRHERTWNRTKVPTIVTKV